MRTHAALRAASAGAFDQRLRRAGAEDGREHAVERARPANHARAFEVRARRVPRGEEPGQEPRRARRADAGWSWSASLPPGVAAASKWDSLNSLRIQIRLH